MDGSVTSTTASSWWRCSPNCEQLVAVFSELACHDHIVEMHHGQNPRIEVHDDSHASGRWGLYYYLIDTRQHTVTQLAGFYEDDYVLVDGRWMICKSTYQVTSTQIPRYSTCRRGWRRWCSRVPPPPLNWTTPAGRRPDRPADNQRVTPERIARLRQVLDRRQPDLTVVTDFVHKQRNLSAIVRVCDAVGIMRVHAVLGDEDYQAFRGTAMGSHHWVEVRRYVDLPAALDYTRPTVLLLGAERRGLSPAAREMANACVAVPMVGMVGSLNVSVAAGIILAEAQRQRQQAGMYDCVRIDHKTYQRLFFQWGHPEVREFCEQRGLRYPRLDQQGEIDDPSAWYASVREGTAPRWEAADE
jgi:tRNA (guanosine-2'-O-)-methyltransferase